MRKWLLIWMFSFIAIVNAGKADMEHNEQMGCEVIGEWKANSGRAPKYLFLHCPDEVFGQVSGADGYWYPVGRVPKDEKKG